jgi:SAM-dependent methyltransferase
MNSAQRPSLASGLHSVGVFLHRDCSNIILIHSSAPPPDSSEKPAYDPESSFVNLPSYLGTASGTVLEVGPGSGSFAAYLNAPAIKAIYGAEPSVGMHAALMMSAKLAGLGEKYHILPCGGERDSLLPALAKAGLFNEVGGQAKEQGVFDTIICIRVLCSVPDLESTLNSLYSLLKPGGRFIICEHVINPW